MNYFQGLLHIALTSIGSIVVMFLLTKLLGKRQMSQLSMFDYIIGITIGSIAAEMATALEDDFMQPLLAMVLYASFALLISWAGQKSIKWRRFLIGEATILYKDQKLYEKNLKKAHLDINEFLTVWAARSSNPTGRSVSCHCRPSGRPRRTIWDWRSPTSGSTSPWCWTERSYLII